MITFPDVSNYDAGWVIPEGTPAIIARSTLATTYLDPSYPVFKQRASDIGARFAGYHWLNHGHVVAQAFFAWHHDVPIMIDAEDMPGNDGYFGPLTVGDIRSFALEYRQLGGICNVVYLPHWYWQDHMGSPSLQPLIDIGLHLVSSNYSGVGGWTPYGGMTPFQWQYTDKPHDMNMFNGTIDEWWNIFTGADMSFEQIDRDVATADTYRLDALLGNKDSANYKVSFEDQPRSEVNLLKTQLDRIEKAQLTVDQIRAIVKEEFNKTHLAD